MDTPLYVLSTAASMVESVDVSNYHQNIEEAALKRTYNERDTPSQTETTHSMLPRYEDLLPTTSINPPTNFRDSISHNSKKCTGTQTSFSSFSSSTYGPSEKYVKTDSGSMAWHGHKPSCPSGSPPSYYSHQSGPKAPHYGYTAHEDMETDHDMPLNLTKSSSSHQSNNTSSSSSPVSRPSPPSSRHSSSSVSPTPRHTVIIRNAPVKPTTSDASQSMCNNSKQDKVLNEFDDPEIEEHFRRSLGAKYMSYVASRSSPRNGETADTGSVKPSNVSITGNVDDHFAKSLGDTWTKLNATKPSAVLTGTVDDHFAKALGDTWYKIKANSQT